MRLAMIAAVAATGLMPMRAASPTQPVSPPRRVAEEVRIDTPDTTTWLDALAVWVPAESSAEAKKGGVEIGSHLSWARIEPPAPVLARSTSGTSVFRSYACNAGGVIEEKILRVNAVIVLVGDGGDESPADSARNP